MPTPKKDILANICYTELVYGRINKKLQLSLSNDKIEELVLAIIKQTDEVDFKKIGKNIYISNQNRNIGLTINSYIFRIITADKLNRGVSVLVNQNYKAEIS